MHSTERHFWKKKKKERKRKERKKIEGWEIFNFDLKRNDVRKIFTALFNHYPQLHIVHEIYKRIIVVIALLWLRLLYYYIIYIECCAQCFFSRPPCKCDDAGGFDGREREWRSFFYQRDFLIYVNAKIFYVRCFNFSLIVYLSFKYV